jgi:hypothetical protein
MKILTIQLTFIALTTVLAQDKDMEARFFNQRNEIKQKGIKEISESVFQEWKMECSRGSAKLRLKYSFDKSGNLVQVDDYRDEELYKTIKYKRNESGRYYEKTYLHYDSTGRVKFTDNWDFEFDKKGRPVIERCRRDTSVWLTNFLSYDKKGNYIKQVRDGYYEWHFKYDKKGKLTESNECIKYTDSTRCFNFTKYQYIKDLLTSEIKLAPRADTVWKKITYTYDDRSNLVQILDPIKWTSKTNDEPVKNIPEYMTFTYDEQGNCDTKSLSRKDEKPFRCYYYDYKYY